MSVSFADGDGSQYEEGYMTEQSPVGLVYVPLHGVEIDEDACIRYERYPWIEKFELDGIRPAAVCCIWQPGGQTADINRHIEKGNGESN